MHQWVSYQGRVPYPRPGMVRRPGTTSTTQLNLQGEDLAWGLLGECGFFLFFFLMVGKTSSSSDRVPQGKVIIPPQIARAGLYPIPTPSYTHSKFWVVSCGGLPTRPSYPLPCHASSPPPSAPARLLAPSVPPRTFLMMSSSLPGTTPSCTIRSCPSVGALSSNKWALGTRSPRSLQIVSQLLMDTTMSSSSAQVRVLP